MNCLIYKASQLPDHERVWIAHRLTKAGSDFNGKLVYWTYGRGAAVDTDGSIAVVYDQGEIIGWARTELWRNDDTLEAFVAPAYRGRGVASYAAAGLVSTCLHDNGMHVAVFHPLMLLVARRVGLFASLFQKAANGEWVRA
jgi:GNAT superfamily N-acetyltransferase